MAEEMVPLSKVQEMIDAAMAAGTGISRSEQAKRDALAKQIGPVENWKRCFSCGTLADDKRYQGVDWEPKLPLEYHSSDIWREMYNNGMWFCVACHKSIHMREGKETKRRIKAGEMEDPALETSGAGVPVVGGMTRSAGGSVKERS